MAVDGCDRVVGTVMDAISLLKDDHKTVERLFKRFEKAGDRAYVEKRQVVDRIIAELAVHASIEEQLFYPVARATVPETEDIALESLEEHHIVKWVLSELEGMSPEHERFDAKVTVLIENVRHHVKEEEQEYFPMVRDELGRKALSDLGEAMQSARGVAPTHPHPRSPDTPPGNLAVGMAAGVVDRVGDTMSGVAQGGAAAVGDAIATVLRRKKPQVAGRGIAHGAQERREGTGPRGRHDRRRDRGRPRGEDHGPVDEASRHAGQRHDWQGSRLGGQVDGHVGPAIGQAHEDDGQARRHDDRTDRPQGGQDHGGGSQAAVGAATSAPLA